MASKAAAAPFPPGARSRGAGCVIRIGAGAGYSGDRLEPAVDLARRGALDYLVFECLAERTIALAVRARQGDPESGFDPFLDERMRAVLPACVDAGTRIISNMGAANAVGAARRTAAIAREMGLSGLRVAAVHGDDVLDLVRMEGSPLLEQSGTIGALSAPLVSANAYLGCEPLVVALAGGAHVVLTGRVADPSLFLAPMVHAFGWGFDDWAILGRGTVIGHLMECAGQVTGGYHADPGFKDVPSLADLGFPIAEVAADGSAVLTKLTGSGGRITLATCKEQLLYELHDPSRYLTPDVTADFSTVTFSEVGADRVAISGGGGTARPDQLKVSVGYEDGFIGEGQISYAGPGALERGRLALDIVAARLTRLGGELLEHRLDLVGVDAVCVSQGAWPWVPEVRARVAVRTRSAAAASWAGREVEALYTNGPAGGGGAAQSVRPVIAIASVLIERAQIAPSIHWEVS